MQPPDPLDPESAMEKLDWSSESSPYQSPTAIEPTADRQALPNRPQRNWTALAVPAISLACFLFTSGFMLVVALAVVHGRVDRELLRDPAAYRAISESRIGLFLVVVIPQFAMLIPPVVAANLSPVPTLRRLGLVRGQWPLWGWVAAALATPLVGLVSSVVVGKFMTESENLKMMTEIFRGHGDSGFLVPLVLMIGLTPAICEELLFRGYVQTRLTRTAGATGGVLLASALFALFHLDLVHIIAVFPLGLYLGFVSWRSGSLIPAMIGHFVNNAVSVIAVVLAPQGETDVLDLPVAMVSLSIIGTGIISVLAVIAVSIAYGRPPDTAA
jgi:membrane protease YdiL (CAAX protease family)